MKNSVWLVITTALVAGAFVFSGTLGIVSGLFAVLALGKFFFTAHQTKQLLQSGAQWYISKPKRKDKARKWIHRSD